MENQNRQAIVSGGQQQAGGKPPHADVPRDGDTLFEMPDRPTGDQLLQKLLKKIEAKRASEPKQQKFKTPRSIRPSAELCGKKLLGRGGLGCVYRYHDQELGRDLAMKVCQHHILLSRTGIERFIRERRITARLAHPSIPPVHHCGELKDGRPYYVMRLIRGRSLQRLLQQRKSLPLDYRRDRGVSRMLDAFERVCDAAQYAHNAKVIHRDIKPANIILEKNGAAFLVDWGLGRESGNAGTEPQSHDVGGEAESPNLTQSAIRIGSPDYMSPEQAEGSVDQHGPPTDVYGLGATLYHILTGVAPHAPGRPGDSESREEMYARIAKVAPPLASSLVPNLPAALASICCKAMQRNPSDRYESARDLRDDLVRWRRNELVQAHADRYSLTNKMQLFAVRHRSLVTAIAAGFVILLLVSIASAAVVADKNTRLDATNVQLTITNLTLDQKNVELDAANVKLVSTNQSLDDKVDELNEANRELKAERDQLELSLQIGFKILRGIEAEKYQSLNDVYIDILQNGFQLPNDERAAMLPLYKAMISMQKADDFFAQKAGGQSSRYNLLNDFASKTQAASELYGAIELLDESIRQSDKIGLAWLLRAQLRMEYLSAPKDDVLNDWDRAVELLPNCSAVFCGRGWCLIGLRRFEQAIEDLSEAVEIDPLNEYAHRGIAEVFFDEKKFGSALEHYYIALDLPSRYNTNPNWKEVLYNDIATTHWSRAFVRKRDDDVVGAVEDFCDALKYCKPQERPIIWEKLAVMLTSHEPNPKMLKSIDGLYTVWEGAGQAEAFELTRECIELLAAWRFGVLSLGDVEQMIEKLNERRAVGTIEITSSFVECLKEIESDGDLQPDKLKRVGHMIKLLE